MKILILTALLVPCIAIAQPIKTRTTTNAAVRPTVSTQALPADFAANVTGTSIIEYFTAEHPCVPHSHEYVKTLWLKRRSGSFPSPTAVLYRDGAQVESWTIGGPPGDTLVRIGDFKWSADHPCPNGTTTIGPPTPPNYRLVVDPANRVAEQSEANNTISFHVDPSVPLIKLP